MTLMFERGNVQIWAIPEVWGVDYWVYGITKSGDPVVCPSLGVARARAA